MTNRRLATIAVADVLDGLGIGTTDRDFAHQVRTIHQGVGRCWTARTTWQDALFIASVRKELQARRLACASARVQARLNPVEG